MTTRAIMFSFTLLVFFAAHCAKTRSRPRLVRHVGDGANQGLTSVVGLRS